MLTIKSAPTGFAFLDVELLANSVILTFKSALQEHVLMDVALQIMFALQIHKSARVENV